MNSLARFQQYADAFEEVFESDDWSRLEPYFTEDAIYEIHAAPPFGARSEGRAHLIFARSKDAPTADMSALLREALPSVEGKGGGSPHIAQGGGPRLDGLEEALAGARRSLVSQTS